MSFTTYGFGSTPSSGMGFANTRGRIQGSFPYGVNYPSPFFDVAHTYLPSTVKQLFRFCRYYFLTNPLVNATVFKLSEYPVTDIIIDHEDPLVKRRWTEYFHDHLRYRSFEIETGLDYFCFGTCPVSVGFPFQKFLKCKTCGWTERADKIRNYWTFSNMEFRLSCPSCGNTGEAGVKDHYYKNANGLNLLRWNVEDVEVTHNDISGQSTYFYTVPGPLKADITIGKKDVVQQIPQIFIQALRQNKGVIFSKENLFVLKRPTLAWQDRGWGVPLLLPVLKDTFYLQLMKKAQEAILLEHIVPLRVLFPQAASGSSDPFCLTFRTLTEANYGYKPAGEVKKGDLIKTASGNYQPVTAVVKRRVRVNEDVFRFRIAGMSAAPVEPSEEHPFLAVRMNGKQKRKNSNWVPDWVEAKDLNVGDYVAYPLAREVRQGLRIDLAQYLANFVSTDLWVYRQITTEGAAVYEHVEAREQRAFAFGELQKTACVEGWTTSTLQTTASRYRRGHRTERLPRFIEWSKDFATILGYYLAEGCVDEGRIDFSLHREETWICDELDEAFTAVLGKTGIRSASGENGLHYRINDSIFAEFLRSYGGHLAWNKALPAEVVHLPENVLSQLVRCMINGDGGPENVVRDNPHAGRPCRTTSVTYTTTSLQLALKLRELLLYLGIVGKVHTTLIRGRMRHDIHRVKVNGQMALDLWKILGWSCDEQIEVKKDTTRMFIRDGYAFFRVRSKERLKNVEYVYGFQVDGDKSFCVPTCATHNTTINLTDWRDQVAAEIARWRFDQNYIPIMPLPVGQQTVGGDGKALLLFNEIQTLSEHIIMGMGVPREFLMGGMSYAGTNVSMRMLENAFISYVGRQRLLANWIMKTVAHFMEWPEAHIRFKPFKMADDIQRKAYLFQMNQAGKISDHTLASDADLDQDEEDEMMIKETTRRLEATKKQQLAMAEIQGEAQQIMMKFQAKAQQDMMKAQGGPQAPGEPGGPDAALGMGAAADQAEMSSTAPQQAGSQLGAGQDLGVPPEQAQAQGAPAGLDIISMATMYARQIMAMPPDQQQMAVQNLQMQSPELAQLVLQMMRSQGSGGGRPQPQQPAGVDMRPMPEKLPQRRAAPTV